MKLYGYQPAIIEACDCSPEVVAEVEELMRLQTGGVLDSLRPAEFDRLARVCREALSIMDTEAIKL